MEYSEFERILSGKRLRRYTEATGGDTRKAMVLYRYNLKLSQEIFTIVSCFEVALRNAIDDILSTTLGVEWLKDSIMPNGMFSTGRMNDTKRIIEKAYQRLVRNGNYSPSKMIAELEFGVWKYMFSAPQYRATGQCLLRVFPYKPRSSAAMQYNPAFFFNELDKVNASEIALPITSPSVSNVTSPSLTPATSSTSIRKSKLFLHGWALTLIRCSMVSTTCKPFALKSMHSKERIDSKISQY